MITVQKRNGDVVPFLYEKIEQAVVKAAQAVASAPQLDPSAIVDAVTDAIRRLTVPVSVETIQDAVERALLAQGHRDVARAYMTYRDEKAAMRRRRPVSAATRAAFDEAATYFPTALQQFQFFDKYSRFNYALARRETWVETVNRAVDFLVELTEATTGQRRGEVIRWLQGDGREMMLRMEALPSMRLLAMAGEPARRQNLAIYNCSAICVDDLQVWVEMLIISMSGCGVGFSVERKYIDKLPSVSMQTGRYIDHVVDDSTEGWAEALRLGLQSWFVDGVDVRYDFSQVRPAGAPLKTKGGRACLTGDTVIFRDDRKAKKEQQQLTLEDAFYKWHKTKGNFKALRIRAMDEESGAIVRNKVLDIVDNGVQPICRVVTRHGYSIRATSNHRFMNAFGEWAPLSTFKLGDMIAVNGTPEKKTGKCVDCSTPVSRRAFRCRPCANEKQIKPNALETTARTRKGCRAAMASSCAKCQGTERLHVHHVDKNPLNNNPANLVCLCESCHNKEHWIENNKWKPRLQLWVDYDEIVAITPEGTERVYDVCMQAPNHNFVANGFISHNSGPDPLRIMLLSIRNIILSRQGQRLRDTDAHTISCHVGQAAVQGGMRRTAMISLSDADSTDMARIKQGNYDPVLWNANNSSVWHGGVDDLTILRHFVEMDEGKNGERGIFSRDAAMATMPERRRVLWPSDVGVCTNPCAEILLRGTGQLCNLSIAVARADDTVTSLSRKVKAAAVFGTIQSTATNFPGLRPIWKENCDAERLLGVDINGQLDCPLFSEGGLADDLVEKVYAAMRLAAVEQNRVTAAALGINASTAVTCVKPSGNSSTLLDCSPGLHPRHAAYYIRNVRVSSHSPVYKVLRDAGAPLSPENGQTAETATTWVCSFPCKAPDGATVKADETAMDQLERWWLCKQWYTEHNPSVTITYKPHELVEVAAWVARHRDIVGGLSFLPYSGAAYEQMPYVEISREEYEARAAAFPVIDWSKLVYYEDRDLTTAAQELACAAGACLI